MKNINAYCSICGKGYHICNSCKEQKTFTPWRSVVDSIEHYKVYLAIHGYSISKNKEVAKSELENCNLSDLDEFKPEIRTIIEEIISETKKVKTVSRKEKLETKENTNISTDDVKE